MKNIITIVGARPQFIKAAALSYAIKNESDGIQEKIIHTGQHFDESMSNVFFEELGIPKPFINLDINSLSHGEMTAQQLIELEKILMLEKPDGVLVYGDTNSTLAGALAAVKLHIPVIHVEAGLRSFNRKMPEEINRIVTDHVSNFLFAPTQIAMDNLKDEGLDSKSYLVGDIMFDAVKIFGDKADNTLLKNLAIEEKNYLLLTIHRAELTENLAYFEKILDELEKLSKQYLLVFPAHPRTKNKLKSIGQFDRVEKFAKFIEPVSYLDMLTLERNALAIITDSGGVQKEAYFQSVPCITLRNETEWVELVDAGWNKLYNPDTSGELLSVLERHLELKRDDSNDIYGDGNSRNNMLNIISEHL